MLTKDDIIKERTASLNKSITTLKASPGSLDIEMERKYQEILEYLLHKEGGV